MRVLHLYGGNLYGGVERLLATLAQDRAAAPAIAQEFALCFRGRLWRELEAAGVAVHPLGAPRASRPWQVRAARQRLRRWLRARPAPPDLALCHAWWSYALFGPALRRAGVPVGLWAHDCASGRGWLERWAGRHRPDRALALSDTMASSLQHLFPGLHASTWRPPVPLPPPLAPAARAALRRELATPDDALVVLQASRLEPWKGHALLLQALAQLPASAPWVAWLAGGAQRPHERLYLERLRRQADALGLEPRLRWLGERGDVAALMGAADVFCQPNTSPEPFGLVFVEALAAALPVVSCAGGGASEIVTSTCGRLTEPAPAAVAAALRELLQEPALRRELGSAGRAHAQALCDPATQMRRWQQWLLEAAP
ncbi:MAG TPA: glycosyltransferase family 4 protein [Terriglobales bacterium]|nr:glycosyltransferase family 4 protein [Terriglobales bacterium]